MPEGDLISFLLQKAGHFLEYFLLAWLVYRAIRATLALTGRSAEPDDRSSPIYLPGRGSRLAYSLALAVTLLFATSDEWHQSFVPTREPALRDVLIDTAGALTALAAARRLERRRASGPIPTQEVPRLQRDPQ